MWLLLSTSQQPRGALAWFWSFSQTHMFYHGPPSFIECFDLWHFVEILCLWSWRSLNGSMDCGVMIFTTKMYKLSPLLVLYVVVGFLFVCKMGVSKVQQLSYWVSILPNLHCMLCNVLKIREIACSYLNLKLNNVILCNLVNFVILCDLPSYTINPNASK